MNLIQETLFPPQGFPDQLYLGIRNPDVPRKAVVTHDIALQRDVINLIEDDTLTTDTYFGGFYCAYWTAYTDIRSIYLALQVRGAGEVKVYEDSGNGIAVLSDHEVISNGQVPLRIDVSPTNMTDSPFAGVRLPSRIFVEFKAMRPSSIISVNFMSDQQPVREVTLSIGLCTFNQESYFVHTAKRIAKLIASEPAVRQVYVVNQGKPFASPEIVTILQGAKITSIQQRNLGGCGGFTRSLREALAADAPTTHHLMMDDDIVLDERMISRAINFLRFAPRDIALGGSMLESLRPTIMYEAGAYLRANNTIEPYCHNVDMADTGQMYHFNQTVPTDYNAWWFCILPLEPAARAGLPAPIFIRGDDFEYGQRLAALGVPTVTLPGVAVWHEPFYAKPPSWQDYYDMRNRMIFGATYGNKVSQLSLTHVLGLLSSAILTHQYMSAELRLLAIDDFLKGPQALFADDAEVTHQRVMAVAKANTPVKLPNDQWRPKPATLAKPKPAGMRAMAKSYLSSALKTLLMPGGLTAPRVLLDADANPLNTGGRSFVLTNGLRTFHILFRPNRFRTFSMLIRAVNKARKFRRDRETVGADWNNRIKDYRTEAFWGKVFQETPSDTVPRRLQSDASDDKNQILIRS